jgi:hypothetical protein
MKFATISEFKQYFKQSEVKLPAKIEINGIKFNRLTSSTKKWEDIVNGSPGILIYSAGKQHKEDAKKVGLDEWLALTWKAVKNTIKPLDVYPTTQARISFKLKEAAEPNTIGDVVRVKITSLPSSQELKGRVDTGATVSSLHAEKWNIVGDQVKFVSKDLSPNVITTKLIDKQAVKSADGGTEYRPVIEFNIKINDKQMQQMQFNLNDRGQMEFPLLIGQNVLEKGKFLIDPSINEDIKKDEIDNIDWDQVYENIEAQVQTQNTDDVVDEQNPQIDAICETLYDAGITLNEFIECMSNAAETPADDVSM